MSGNEEREMTQSEVLSLLKSIHDLQNLLKTIFALDLSSIGECRLSVKLTPSEAYSNALTAKSPDVNAMNKSKAISRKQRNEERTSREIAAMFLLIEADRQTMSFAPSIESTLDAHRNGIAFVLPKVKSKSKFTSSPVCAAVVEMYEKDPVKTEEFVNTLWRGDMKNKTAQRLREYLLGNSPCITESDRLECFKIASRHCNAALRNKSVLKRSWFSAD